MERAQFRAAVEHLDGTTIVWLSGELDMAVEDRVLECLDLTSGAVIIDLSAVTHLDSSALKVLDTTDRRLSEHAGSMTIRNPNQLIRRILEIAGLDNWIEAPSRIG